MKKTSKISVVLIALTLLISSFAVFASADDSVADAYDYKSVLEYYEAGYYLNATFNDAATLDDAFADSSEDFGVSGKVSYVNNSDGTATMQSLSPLYLDIATKSSVSFGINTKLKLDSSTMSSIALRLHSVKRSDSTDEVIKVFEITPSAVIVYKETVDSVPSYDSIEYAVEDGVFAIEFFFDKTEASEVITLTITPASEGAEAKSITLDVDGFGFKAIDLSTVSVTMDYCEIYKGSFVRKLSGSQADIAKHLNKLVSLYNANPAGEHAFKYLEVAAKVFVEYGFNDESTVAAAKTAVETVAPEYAKRYVEGASAIKSDLDYHVRLDYVNSLVPYDTFLESMKNGYSDVDIKQTAEAIAAANALVDTEFASLAKAKEDTLYTCEEVYKISNVYVADYTSLKQAYDAVSAHPICKTYYDDEYTLEKVVEAARYAEAIVSEFKKKDSMATIFTTNVPVMCDTAKPFGERYAAYVLARDNKFTDTTYNAYLENTTIEKLVADFETVLPEISVAEDYAEEFLLKIQEADVTASYAVKIIALDAAEPYIADVERGYPGVKEAIDKYYALRQDINNRFETAKKYINAVLDVQAATTIEEKVRLIGVAKAYAAFGADVSIEVTDMSITVTQANIILSNEESALLLVQAHVDSYISTVNSIATKADMQAKRAAISRALALQVGVDTTADGVAAANETLQAAIAAYNAEVKAANALSSECNNLAMETVSRTIPTVTIAQIVAIVKKFFD